MRIIAFLITVVLAFTPAANAGDLLERESRATDRPVNSHAIDALVQNNDASAASDGTNFLVVWVKSFATGGVETGLQAMVVGPRGNVVVEPHLLQTGLSHARPAVAWTGDSYVVVSLDTQLPRRIVAHRVDASGQLLSDPPVVVKQETLSEGLYDFAAIRIAASGDAAYVNWEGFSWDKSGLYFGLVRLDRDGTVKPLRLPTVNTESIATDGSTVFLGQGRGGGCMYPECVGSGGDLVAVPDSADGLPRVADIGIVATSLASSPGGVFYIAGRDARFLRGDVRITTATSLPASGERSTWVGHAFLTVWLDVDTATGSRALQLRGAWITPEEGTLSVTPSFVVPFVTLRIMALAGNNRGSALILGRNDDNSLEWTTVSLAPPRNRAVRR